MKLVKNATPCTQCGMRVHPDEYHPYAACLLFKACHDAETVYANLDAVLIHGAQRYMQYVKEDLLESEYGQAN